MQALEKKACAQRSQRVWNRRQSSSLANIGEVGAISLQALISGRTVEDFTARLIPQWGYW